MAHKYEPYETDKTESIVHQRFSYNVHCSVPCWSHGVHAEYVRSYYIDIITHIYFVFSTFRDDVVRSAGTQKKITACYHNNSVLCNNNGRLIK